MQDEPCTFLWIKLTRSKRCSVLSFSHHSTFVPTLSRYYNDALSEVNTKKSIVNTSRGLLNKKNFEVVSFTNVFKLKSIKKQLGINTHV